MTSRLRTVGDEALRTLTGMKPEEALRPLKSGFKYGMKLPRANGKGASLPTYEWIKLAYRKGPGRNM